MTRMILSSAAIAAILSLNPQPASAQSYNPKEFTIQKKAAKGQQPSSVSGQRPRASKDKHKGEIEVLSISPGAGSSAAKKRRPVAR